MNGVLVNIPFGHLEKFPLLYTALFCFHILGLVEFSILITSYLLFVLLLITSYNICIIFTGIVSIFGNERLVRSGGSLRNTSWKGEKLLNASNAMCS